MLETKTLRLKQDDFDLEAGTFKGYASVFGGNDAVNDTILKGAYSEVDKSSVVMLAFHDVSRPIGIFTEMAEDDTGLLVKGEFTKGVRDADEMLARLKHKSVDAMSVGFPFAGSAFEEKEDGSFGRIYHKINLKEISLVPFPADDAARVEEVKSERKAAKYGEDSWLKIVEKSDDLGLKDFSNVLRAQGMLNKDMKLFVSACKHFFGSKSVSEAYDATDEISKALQRAINS